MLFKVNFKVIWVYVLNIVLFVFLKRELYILFLCIFFFGKIKWFLRRGDVFCDKFCKFNFMLRSIGFKFKIFFVFLIIF